MGNILEKIYGQIYISFSIITLIYAFKFPNKEKENKPVGRYSCFLFIICYGMKYIFHCAEANVSRWFV